VFFIDFLWGIPMKQSLYAMIAVMVVLLAGLLAGPGNAGAQVFFCQNLYALGHQQ
jgi:hypothetical protein